MGQITVADVAQAVADQVPAFFNDAIDQLRQGEGAYLANGQPQGVVAKIGQAVGRGACRRFGANPSGNPTANSSRFEKACRPYLESLSPGKGITLTPPFQGGQCPNVLYQAQPETLNQTTGQWGAFTTISNIRGPILSLRTEVISANNTRWVVTYTGPGGVGTQTQVATNGVPQNRARWGPVTRQDGQPDNCGNPTPIITQPQPIPDPTPPPFRFNPAPGLDVDVDVRINPDGTITFDIGTGDVTIDPFPGGDDGGGLGPGDQTGPGTPGTPGDTGGGGAEDGEAPPGEELVGVLVQVLAAPQGANTFDNNSAQVYRGIGYVRMGFAGRLGTDISGGTVISPQFFHAQQRGLTNWEVRANLGFNLRVTPYYRTIEP